MGLGDFLRSRAQLNMAPSPTRSALVQHLLQQAGQANPGSMSFAESANIASKPILAALLAKQEEKAQRKQMEQEQGLAGNLASTIARTAIDDPDRTFQSTPNVHPNQGEGSVTYGANDRARAAKFSALLQAGQMPNNPLAQAILGSQAESMFTQPEPVEIERVGQRVVKGVGESEVFRDKGNNLLFYQDDAGNRKYVSSSDVTTPVERQEVRTGQLQGAEEQSVRDQIVASKNYIATVGDALTLLQQNPDVNTWTGSAAQIVNNLQAEVKAVARNMGINFDSSVLDPKKYASAFDGLGIDSAQMQSLIVSLAFQGAAAEGVRGSTVSNRDVERFIKQTGADNRDPRAFAQSLYSSAERVLRNTKNNWDVRYPDTPFEGDLGLSSLPVFGDESDALDKPLSEMTDEELDRYEQSIRSGGARPR